MIVLTVFKKNKMDQKTLERIETMHPIIREQLKEQYLYINSKLPNYIRLRFSYCLRTIEEQNQIFAQGRTKPGRIVTNAKGGQSIHNYGLAFDIVILHDKDKNGTFETASWDLDKHFMKVVNYFKSEGWEWGGDWNRFKDYPHFQLKKIDGSSYNWRELLNLPKNSIYPKL